MNERPFLKPNRKDDFQLPSSGIGGELVDLGSGRGGGGGTISGVSDGSISVELQRLGFLRNKIMAIMVYILDSPRASCNTNGL